eukprot:scaffold62867_cov15-Prasinocladus_malaysianus.AAC.1
MRSVIHSFAQAPACVPPEDECPMKKRAHFSAEFREHAMHGSIEHCKKYVQLGADVHSVRPDVIPDYYAYYTPLMAACVWQADDFIGCGTHWIEFGLVILEIVCCDWNKQKWGKRSLC